jgi:predicted DNA-binding transcriptional regulator AlpA
MSTNQRAPPVEPLALSLAEFCSLVGISKRFYYQLKSENLTPTEVRLKGRVLISRQTAIEWLREREAAS